MTAYAAAELRALDRLLAELEHLNLRRLPLSDDLRARLGSAGIPPLPLRATPTHAMDAVWRAQSYLLGQVPEEEDEEQLSLPTDAAAPAA